MKRLMVWLVGILVGGMVMAGGTVSYGDHILRDKSFYLAPIESRIPFDLSLDDSRYNPTTGELEVKWSLQGVSDHQGGALKVMAFHWNLNQDGRRTTLVNEPTELATVNDTLVTTNYSIPCTSHMEEGPVIACDYLNNGCGEEMPCPTSPIGVVQVSGWCIETEVPELPNYLAICMCDMTAQWDWYVETCTPPPVVDDWVTVGGYCPGGPGMCAVDLMFCEDDWEIDAVFGGCHPDSDWGNIPCPLCWDFEGNNSNY